MYYGQRILPALNVNIQTEVIATEDCLFCKIANGELPSKKLLETDELLAFEDIRPQAPVHVLLIPKKHIQSVQELEPEDKELVGELHLAAQKLAVQLGVEKDGYRIVSNVGFHGQQTVLHLHFHLLGGRQLQWPPG
ncbi:histidine triad nucleotide-binding protein [Alicyclobacillus sp. SO9]|uniref:histidine triad nucleotide-binding protein n=1 Tax=Alicyclobacillus sp. SO9 TaxID=2665646 RepID=UPI0018E8083D|nr:histidine triad nucleotide-binding protein [Alicyclobacillus sp. SO9]QQE80340.1 histidine triad nucleotide-binding protein [Alicyclobacillus sp. SO9]